MMNVIILNVIMLNVVTLSVMAPWAGHTSIQRHAKTYTKNSPFQYFRPVVKADTSRFGFQLKLNSPNIGPGAVFTTLHFCVTYESVQQARLLHNIELERLTSDKHSNLLGLLTSYEENKVLRLTNWSNKLECFSLESISSLLQFNTLAYWADL